MSNLILPEYDNFLERVETGLSKKLDLTKIPEWICKNTRDPRNKRLRWAFADHEFQMGILSEAAAAVIDAERRDGMMTPVAPNAAADRTMAPRLRGSVMPSRATTMPSSIASARTSSGSAYS